MKRTILQALLGLQLLLCAAAARGQTFYVDSAAASGGDGSAAHPWNNILSAVWGSPQPVSSDVTIYFRKGTYYFNYAADSIIYLGSTKSGLNGHQFTLASYPGEQAVFDGSRLTTAYGYMVNTAGASNVRLRRLVFANITNMNAYGVVISGASDSVHIDSCTFRNMLWNSDTAEARFPTGADYNIAPVIINGSLGGTPDHIRIDSSSFINIACGATDSVITLYGTVGAVTVAVNSFSNIILKQPRYQFYVSTAGSDVTGTGSKAKPWATPRYAANNAGYDWSTGSAVLVNSDVTIYLRAGTYYLDTSIYIGPNRGQNGKWTILTHYPGEDATLDGGNLHQKFSCIVIIDSASYVEVRGLNLQNLTDDSTLNTPGSKDSRFGIEVAGKCSHITIDSNDLYNMKWTRDTVKAKNPQPNDVLSAITVLGNSNTPISNLVISENTIHNIVPGYAEGMTLNGNVDSFTISGNEVYDVANIGIVAAGNYKWVLQQYPSLLKANNQVRNGLIKDNSVYRCISPVATSAGIYLDGSLNVTVQGNESYNNGTGLSVGNEQDSSSSGGHTIISNNFWSNLGPGMYLGSNNSTSTCTNVLVKYNTDSINWTINPTLYARANGRYGTADTSGQAAEIVMQRIQNLTFDENDVYSSSDNVLIFSFVQSGAVFTYNDYYTKHNNPCKAYFLRDTVGNGLAFKSDTTFNQYGQEMGLDTTSSLGGVAYNRHGCGTHSTALVPAGVAGSGLRLAEHPVRLYEYPNPVEHGLYVHIQGVAGGPASLELFDLSGRMVVRQDLVLSAGTNDIGWPDLKQRGVSTGLYVLQLITETGRTTVKVVVK